ncbi:MAG TPA: acyl-CoA dehydrogenase family protein [Natronosporangium sp.]
MDLQPSPEQQALAETTHQALIDQDAPGAARRWAAGDLGPGQKLWTVLAGTGLPGLLVPDRFGGLGLGLPELTACLTEIGHHAAPGPWVESVAVVPALLGHPSTGDRYAEMLTRLAAGETVATAATAGPDQPPLFPDAEAADLLVAIEPDRVTGYRSPPAGSLTPARSVDPVRRLARLSDRAPAPAWQHPAEPAAVAAARAAGALGTAAVLLGCGRAAIEAATEHAKTRHQFGRPIGGFQAVKHRLADALTELAFAEPVLHAAAVAADRALPEAGRDAAAAKLVAADAARAAVTAALQVHGAIGYTDEHPLSLWLRRVTALRTAWGTPEAHRELIGAALAAGSSSHIGQGR